MMRALLIDGGQSGCRAAVLDDGRTLATTALAGLPRQGRDYGVLRALLAGGRRDAPCGRERAMTRVAARTRPAPPRRVAVTSRGTTRVAARPVLPRRVAATSRGMTRVSARPGPPRRVGALSLR